MRRAVFTAEEADFAVTTLNRAEEYALALRNAFWRSMHREIARDRREASSLKEGYYYWRQQVASIHRIKERIERAEEVNEGA